MKRVFDGTVALLALVGTGAYQSVEEACDATIKLVDQARVDPAVKAYYDRAYPIYRGLYRDLRGSFRDMAALVSGG